MTLSELKAEINRRRAVVAPMLREIEALERQHAEALSREFIAANGITRSMVQTSDVPRQWFGTIWAFGEWMEANGITKPWCEWNDRIYPTTEIRAGSMRRDAPGCMEHVPD